VLGEHRAIMRAALARDADRAVGLLSEHILLTTRLLISFAADAREGGATSAQKIA